MTSKAPKLLHCPWCANDGTQKRLNVAHSPTRLAGWEFTVECTNCGCDGPYASTEKSAETAWNTRDTTHALAMVAAERESCAKIAAAHFYNGDTLAYGERAVAVRLSDTIRARTPADAQAALDAMLKAERVKALREARQLAMQNSESETAWALHELIEKETGHE